MEKNQDEDPIMELEHAIGFAGKLRDVLYFHATDPRKYLTIAGGCLVVSDLDSPHDQLFYRGHDDDITCAAVSPTGRVVATGQRGENSDIVVWDLLGAKMMFRFSEHDFAVTQLAFSHDERLLASTGEDGRLILWDVFTGCIVCSVPAKPQRTDCLVWGGMARDIKRRDTAQYQFATAGERSIFLWTLDPYTGEVTAAPVDTRTTRDYTALRFSPSFEHIFAGTASGDVCCFSVKHKAQLTSFAVCRIGVGALTVTAGHVVVGGGDGSLSVWQYSLPRDEPADFVQVGRAEGLLGAATSLAAADDGRTLLVGTDGGALYSADALAGAALRPAVVSHSHAGPVSGVAFSPGANDRFATCGDDAAVRVWDASTYRVLSTALVRDAGAPHCVAYTGDTLVSGWADGRVRCHTTDADAEPLWEIPSAHKGGVTALLLAHNLRFALTGGADGAVRVWDLRSRGLVCHLKEHSAPVSALALYKDDVHALSASRDRSFLSWDLRQEKRVSAHVQRMGGITGLTLSADEATVATVGQERTLSQWDLRTQDATRVTPAPHGEGEGRCIAASTDGRFLATGGSDNMVQLWDAKTGALRCGGIGHSASVRALHFSPDNKQLVSVGADGCIFVWNVYED